MATSPWVGIEKSVAQNVTTFVFDNDDGNFRSRDFPTQHELGKEHGMAPANVLRLFHAFDRRGCPVCRENCS